MPTPRFPDKTMVTAGQNIEINGKEVGIFLFTVECTDGTIWSRILRTDGHQTDGWMQHPALPMKE